MLGRRLLKPLATIAIAVLLTQAAGAAEGEKRRRRIMQSPDDPYLMFVPGQPLLVAAERGRSVLLLRYPELEVFKKLESPADKKVDVIRASADGKWLAGFYEEGKIKEAGTFVLWNTTSGELRFRLDNGSRTFAFDPKESRWVIYQPKLGITQWAVVDGEVKSAGPTITTVTSIESKSMRLSSDGRHVMIVGNCKEGRESWEICVYRLEDGALVARTRDDWSRRMDIEKAERERRGDPRYFAPRFSVLENEKEFAESLAATKLLSTDYLSTSYAQCKEFGPEHLLCTNAGGAVLMERPKEAETSTTVDGFPGGRALWQIRGTDFGRFYNSCSVSQDGKWAALAVDGVRVLLFDTEKIESRSSFLLGSWSQPTLIKQFEMP